MPFIVFTRVRRVWGSFSVLHGLLKGHIRNADDWRGPQAGWRLVGLALSVHAKQCVQAGQLFCRPIIFLVLTRRVPLQDRVGSQSNGRQYGQTLEVHIVTNELTGDGDELHVK